MEKNNSDNWLTYGNEVIIWARVYWNLFWLTMANCRVFRRHPVYKLLKLNWTLSAGKVYSHQLRCFRVHCRCQHWKLYPLTTSVEVLNWP